MEHQTADINGLTPGNHFFKYYLNGYGNKYEIIGMVTVATLTTTTYTHSIHSGQLMVA